MRVRVLVATVALTVTLTSSAAAAGDPVMRLADVRPGMDCRALTVIQGTTPSEFRVSVIDVLRGAAETSSPRILFRASGPAVASTGVGQGFSGSPIYCPDRAGTDRVIGAISEGVGQYGNDVALATPIEEMLGLRPTLPRRTRAAPALLAAAQPLASPLSVSGLSRGVRSALMSAARQAGVPLLAAPGGPGAPYPRYDPVPGSSIAAGISTGDLALAAIGTVSYRDGRALWAFGHAFEGYGRRSLPLLDAYVHTVIANPLGAPDLISYKLASPGRAIGTLATDGLAGIAGRIGSAPAMIPLAVRARNPATKRAQTLRVRVADERLLGLGTGLDLVGTIAASEAIGQVLGATPPRATTSVCLRVAVRQRAAPLRYCNRYFDPFSPLDDLSRAFSLIAGYKLGPLGIRSANVRISARPRVEEAFIVGARAPRRVRPGQRMTVRLALRRSGGGTRRAKFSVRVPRAVKPGRHVLTVRGRGAGDGAGLAAIFAALFGGGDGSGGPVRSVDELALRIGLLGAPDGVRATFASKGKGRVVLPSRNVLIRGRAQVAVRVRR